MTLFSPQHRSKFHFIPCFCLVAVIALFPSKVLFAQTADSSEITLKINSQEVTVDPPAKLEDGTVSVPLRGVMEKLGAIVTYDADKQRIIIQQNGRTFLLGVDLPVATLDQIEIPLSAAPAVTDGRTFVPLRSLAELFGYKVVWQGATKTVLITSLPSIDHAAALKKWNHFGVTIDTMNLTGSNDVDLLLDAADEAGAGFIKIRFDWSLLEPTMGAAFNWDLFDQLVRGAANRGMGVVGVLGNSTQWASIYENTDDENQWRNAPPQEKYFSNWDNYVRRVVGRYRKDVHAWQVWEYPASFNFRSGARDYRIMVRRGAVMASLADPDAIVFAGDSGGVSLSQMHEFDANGINSVTGGVMLHPVSQWQPGVPANPAAFLLPHSTLRGYVNEKYWADAISWPVLSESTPEDQIFYSTDEALLNRLKSIFTPQAQAAYLVKTATLALAAGIPKTIWGALRDDVSYPKVDPVNPDTNSGLLTTGMQPRPAYEAFKNLSQLLGHAKFVGALSKGPHAVVLLFSDGKQNTAIAWALDENAQPVTLQEVPEVLPNTPKITEVSGNIPAGEEKPAQNVTLKTTPKTQVLDVTGKVLSADDTVALSKSPVWITHLDPGYLAHLQTLNQPPLDDLVDATPSHFKGGVSADFTAGHQTEDGLYWKKYAHFRGEAQPVEYNQKSGIMTTISHDIYNPAAGDPVIYLDVDDDYLYDEPGVPVQVTVDVYRPRNTGGGPFSPQGGFNIKYDSPEGFVFTPWQTVEQGDGHIVYTVDIPRAAFTNNNGYDLVINTWGSKQNLIFRSVKVQQIVTAKTAPEIAPELPDASITKTTTVQPKP